MGRRKYYTSTPQQQQQQQQKNAAVLINNTDSQTAHNEITYYNYYIRWPKNDPLMSHFIIEITSSAVNQLSY